MTPEQIIAKLDLVPHPEGGWYRETYRSPARAGARPHATAIHFLLKDSEVSHWHKVDADEIWLWHAGAPLTLSIAPTQAGPAQDHLLAGDPANGAPQILVPAHHWQAARSTGAYSLVSCIVAPGFDFAGFDLAPPGMDIPRA